MGLGSDPSMVGGWGVVKSPEWEKLPGHGPGWEISPMLEPTKRNARGVDYIEGSSYNSKEFILSNKILLILYVPSVCGFK